MRIHNFVRVLIVATVFSSTGCAGLKQLLPSQPGDYLDSTEYVPDDFGIAGREGRGNQSRQTDPDPWWGKYFMTKKSRTIEENLGIDH